MPHLYWNGQDLPERMRALPPGRYVIEPVDDVPDLSEEEEAGLEGALRSLARGRGVPAEQVRRRAQAALRR